MRPQNRKYRLLTILGSFALVFIGISVYLTHAAIFNRFSCAGLIGPGLLADLLDGALVLLHLCGWLVIIALIFMGLNSLDRSLD